MSLASDNSQAAASTAAAQIEMGDQQAAAEQLLEAAPLPTSDQVDTLCTLCVGKLCRLTAPPFACGLCIAPSRAAPAAVCQLEPASNTFYKHGLPERAALGHSIMRSPACNLWLASCGCDPATTPPSGSPCCASLMA